jgi:hypothetical protein
MAKVDVKFNRAGGNVEIQFFSGVLLSHWIAQLTAPGTVKQRFDGINNDTIPDKLILPVAALPAGAEVDWWEVVFAPTGPKVNYTVTITISQDGKELCKPIVRTGELESHKATAESGEITFS